MPELEWSEVILEFVGFVAGFLAAGAVGFSASALGRRLAAVAGDPYLSADMAKRAAALGLAGALAALGLAGNDAFEQVARRHVDLVTVLGDPRIGLSLGLRALATLGLALAFARLRIGWWLAALGIVGSVAPALLAGRWQRVVNPVHILVAGLWLGTLLVVLLAGLGPVLRDPRRRERRGAIAAALIQGFSPLALVCGLLVVASGALTAYNHLPSLDALVETVYGQVFLVKLGLVGIVFALGAWNWRRQKPLLGTEDAALSLRGSARTELAFAVLVLAVTSVLVTVPAPRPPKPPGETAPGETAAAGAGAAGAGAAAAEAAGAGAGAAAPADAASAAAAPADAASAAAPADAASAAAPADAASAAAAPADAASAGAAQADAASAAAAPAAAAKAAPPSSPAAPGR